MRHTLDPQERSATLITFLGTYKVTLLDEDTVRVDALISDGKWAESRFTPWKYILEALTELVTK